MSILDTFSLKGKTAVVTGGSGLYGKQLVLSLAEAGACVYTVSRNAEANKEYADELTKRGLCVHGGALDISSEESVSSFISSLENEGKKVDILINNSVLRTMRSLHDSSEKFTESMRVNATGLFIMCRSFGDHMAKNGGGSIVNIGSYMGTLGHDDTLYRDTEMTGHIPDYFFHKGGMDNFTRFIASCYGPQNVRCNVLNLGGLYSNQNEIFVKRYNDRTFLKRMANDSDIMGAVLFLASDASKYITGASIPVDGGYSAK